MQFVLFLSLVDFLLHLDYHIGINSPTSDTNRGLLTDGMSIQLELCQKSLTRFWKVLQELRQFAAHAIR
jgi:hypothetical protein